MSRTDWLYRQIAVGKDLAAKLPPDAHKATRDAWDRDRETWSRMMREGIAKHGTPGDLDSFGRIGAHKVFSNPWRDTGSLLTTPSTGDAWPGNDPLNIHLAEIERAEAIAARWYAADAPTVPLSKWDTLGPKLGKEIDRVYDAEPMTLESAAEQAMTNLEIEGVGESQALKETKPYRKDRRSNRGKRRKPEQPPTGETAGEKLRRLSGRIS